MQTFEALLVPIYFKYSALSSFKIHVCHVFPCVSCVSCVSMFQCWIKLSKSNRYDISQILKLDPRHFQGLVCYNMQICTFHYLMGNTEYTQCTETKIKQTCATKRKGYEGHYEHRGLYGGQKITLCGHRCT